MTKSRVPPSCPFVVVAATAVLGLAGCSISAGPERPEAPGKSAVAAPASAGPTARASSGGSAGGLPSTAVYAPQQQLTQVQLENIAQVLRQRAAGMGLKGAQVTLVPQGIQVAALGARAADFAVLGQTGMLAFRPVLAEAMTAKVGSGSVTGQVGGADPAALQAAFARLNCVPPTPSDSLAVEQAADTAPIVACSANQSGGAYTKYALGPVAVAGTHVASAKANLSTQSGGWEVDLTFDAVGTGEFANVTAQLAANPAPTNQFAIVLSGMVQSSPYVSSTITGGQAVISGSFDKAAATGLAAQLSYGSIPPLVLKETVIPG